jgi:hypothetical protein
MIDKMEMHPAVQQLIEAEVCYPSSDGVCGGL